MAQHLRWQRLSAALALCMLLACGGCSGQDAAPLQQDAAAEQTAAATADKGKMTSVAKPEDSAAGNAAAKAAPLLSGKSDAATASAAPGKAAKAPGTASGKGKSASRPQKGTLTKGLSGKDLDAALLKVLLCDGLCSSSASPLRAVVPVCLSAHWLTTLQTVRTSPLSGNIP
jgi:hypothetical protein